MEYSGIYTLGDGLNSWHSLTIRCNAIMYKVSLLSGTWREHSCSLRSQRLAAGEGTHSRMVTRAKTGIQTGVRERDLKIFNILITKKSTCSQHCKSTIFQ